METSGTVFIGPLPLELESLLRFERETMRESKGRMNLVVCDQAKNCPHDCPNHKTPHKKGEACKKICQKPGVFGAKCLIKTRKEGGLF